MGDIVSEALRSILTQPSGAIIVILLIANATQYFFGRRDNAMRDKALAEEKAEHLEDVKKSYDREHQIMELALLKRAR